ncbi:uncharacterized protein [Drosophila kikkawai]|uniref:Uncharacterized protein isoform X3 n=1 Tax=Drosophila kikkawai TaxID=30033 RepID=A0A6P4HLA3_DROKI|nr:uncharacterized protein LOC108070399 isoform X3 [Drosophila kikkawai]
MDVGIGILDLNDYCLQRILHYVDIKGQISFAQTCARFRDVFHVWSRCEYSYVSIVGDVEPRELTLLSLVASSVRKLNIFADDLHGLPEVHQAMAGESTSDRQAHTEGIKRLASSEKAVFVHSNADHDRLESVLSAELILDS